MKAKTSGEIRRMEGLASEIADKKAKEETLLKKKNVKRIRQNSQVLDSKIADELYSYC